MDLARLGVFLLNEGNWQGEQLISEQWLTQATAPSTQLAANYGFLWWLNRAGVIVNPFVATSLDSAARPASDARQMVPEAPEDMYWALGLGNQLLQIDPGTRTVVVRLGGPDV